MNVLRLATVTVCLTIVGLGQAAAQNVQGPVQNTQQKKEPAPVPVPVKEDKAALTPKNTTIQFVGTHVGAEPDPRVGYFTKFSGDLTVDEARKTLKNAALDIDTSSLVTPIAKLTGHLHTPDFFDVRRYPKATFQSTKIEATDAGRGAYKITGDLTIREIKKSITFPATVKFTNAGLVLDSKFTIKRAEFGMTFGPNRVVDEVSMAVTVGKPTPKVTPQ